MKTTVENISPTRVKLTVEVPFEDLQDNITSAYKRIGSQINIPGFRRGKVPSRVIDQRVGRLAVLEEAVNEFLPQAYDEAITQNEIFAVSQPQVEVDELVDGQPLVFKAEVDVRPEFEIGDYDGIAVTVDDAEVSDEKVAEQLDELRKRFATALPVERGAQDGDLVLIDVEGTLDGERLDEFCANAYSYEVGSAGMVSGADETLRGLSKGESGVFQFTPDEGEQSGKEISIKVDVQEVRERELPEADDEFAQLASEFDTLEELKADLRTRVERMALVEQGMAAREKVLEHLLDTIEFPIPESMLDAQVGEHFEDGHGDEEHRAEVVENTTRAIRTQFILDKIADAEELTVGQAELTQWLISQAPRYGMTPDQFADALVQAGQVQMAVADVRRGKALAAVLQKAKVTDESGNEVNLAELDAAVEDEIEEELVEELEEEIVEEALEEAAEIAEVEAEIAEAELEEAEAELEAEIEEAEAEVVAEAEAIEEAAAEEQPK